MFDHVSDEKLRTILSTRTMDEDSICYALTSTRQAVDADESNEDVPFDVLDTRKSAIETAEFMWNEEGRADAAMDALQECWSA